MVEQSKTVKSIRLSDIAEALDYEIVGDGEHEITSLCYVDEADENSLAVAYSIKEVQQTKAQSVLLKAALVPTNKTLIYCGFEDVSVALAKVVRLMIEAGLYPDYEKPIEQTPRGGSMFGANVAIGDGTTIAPFVSVGDDVVIGRNCRIESNAFIGSGSRIGDDVIIRAGARIGVNCHYHYKSAQRHESFCGVGRTILKRGVEIGSNTVIQRGTLSDTVIGDGTLIGNLVEIAHDVKIGVGCLIVSQVGISGKVTIGDGAEIYGQAGVTNGISIGDGAIIFAKAGITHNVKPQKKVSGMFAREHSQELKARAKLRKLLREE